MIVEIHTGTKNKTKLILGGFKNECKKRKCQPVGGNAYR